MMNKKQFRKCRTCKTKLELEISKKRGICLDCYDFEKMIKQGAI